MRSGGSIFPNFGWGCAGGRREGRKPVNSTYKANYGITVVFSLSWVNCRFCVNFQRPSLCTNALSIVFVLFYSRALVWSSKYRCISVPVYKSDISGCRTARRLTTLSDGSDTSLTGD